MCDATLTFEIGVCFFHMTCSLDMPNTDVPNYFKILPCIRELQNGHEWMHINNQAKSVTLTFKMGAWFFQATHNLDMLNTCAKLFQNSSVRKEITAWKWKHAYKHWNCKCDLDLWDRGVVLSLDMSWYAKHFLICQTLLPNYFKFLPCIREL